jgi:hypothetical protein
MDVEKARELIKEELGKGVSAERIREAMMKAGYTKEEIQIAMSGESPMLKIPATAQEQPNTVPVSSQAIGPEKEIMKDKNASRTKLSEEAGVLTLTNVRLTYVGQKKSSGAKAMGYLAGGILGSAIADKLSSKELGEMTIMVSDISNVEKMESSFFERRSNQGAEPIRITLRDDEKVQLVVHKADKWVQAIKSCIS